MNKKLLKMKNTFKLDKNTVQVRDENFHPFVSKIIVNLNRRSNPQYLFNCDGILPQNGFRVTNGDGSERDSTFEFFDSETAERTTGYLKSAVEKNESSLISWLGANSPQHAKQIRVETKFGWVDEKSYSFKTVLLPEKLITPTKPSKVFFEEASAETKMLLSEKKVDNAPTIILPRKPYPQLQFIQTMTDTVNRANELLRDNDICPKITKSQKLLGGDYTYSSTFYNQPNKPFVAFVFEEAEKARRALGILDGKLSFSVILKEERYLLIMFKPDWFKENDFDYRSRALFIPKDHEQSPREKLLKKIREVLKTSNRFMGVTGYLSPVGLKQFSYPGNTNERKPFELIKFRDEKCEEDARKTLSEHSKELLTGECAHVEFLWMNNSLFIIFDTAQFKGFPAELRARFAKGVKWNRRMETQLNMSQAV